MSEITAPPFDGWVSVAPTRTRTHNRVMPPKFNGSLDGLKDKLLLAGIEGEWQEMANGNWQLKGVEGANINWSSTKGTIWCDGKAAPKAAIEEKIGKALGTQFEPQGANSRGAAVISRKVFVVYGHDEKAKTELEAMLRRWNLDPLILDQLTSGGQTIIEKLEAARGQATFAVILATPDDEGNRRDHPEEKAYRARQNVVLELGMMLAVLGRSKVAVVLKTDVAMERPSDIQGLIYVSYKDDLKEAALTLAKEIDAQGIKIDLSKV